MISLGSIVHDVATQLDNARIASGGNVIVDATRLRHCIFKSQMTLRVMALAHIEIHPNIDHITPVITMLEDIEPHLFQVYNHEAYVNDVKSMLATLHRRYGNHNSRSQIRLWTTDVADRDVIEYGLKMCGNAQVRAKESILLYLNDMNALRAIVNARRAVNVKVDAQHQDDSESLSEYHLRDRSDLSGTASVTSEVPSTSNSAPVHYDTDSDDDDDFSDRLSHITVSTAGGIPTFR